MSQFLLKKQQLQAMRTAAKTPQEFQKILDEGSSSFSQENSYVESDDSTSYLPNNGDDCESILSPIRKSKWSSASWLLRIFLPTIIASKAVLSSSMWLHNSRFNLPTIIPAESKIPGWKA